MYTRQSVDSERRGRTYDYEGEEKKGYKMFVYFMRCENFIKIGYEKQNLYRRRSGLRNGNPFEVDTIGVILCQSVDEMKKKENALKEKFKSFHHKNEWYHKSQVLLDYIKAHAEDPQPYLYLGRKEQNEYNKQY